MAVTAFARSLRQQLLDLASRGYGFVDRRPRLVILTLHRLGRGWPIDRAVLRRHLEYLRAHFRLTTPSALAQAGAFVGQQALVVVDDAHADIYEELFPLARALGVPFAVAVPTDFFLRGRWLWFDALAWLLENAPAGACAELGDNLVLSPRDPTSVQACKRRLKRSLPEERERLLDELARRFGLSLPKRPPARYRALSTAEARALLRSGLVEFCPHTVTHTVATVLPPERLAQELAQSKAELEDFTGRPCPAFCYPDGEAGTFDALSAQALAQAGFRLAFTSLEGINRPTTVDWYALKRLHIHPSLSVLRKNASGLGDWLARARATRPARESAPEAASQS